MDNEQKSLQCCLTQCEVPLNQKYWNERWQKSETGWDIGKASPAITTYLLQYPNKNAPILIPGCGNAYEAEFLVASGFTNITLIDIAPSAVELLNQKFKNIPQVKVLCEDFFLHQGNYDLIIEQTFFCAIPPVKRKEYAEKAAWLLSNTGKIVGVLFDKQFEKLFPPFGGFAGEYRPIFEPHFIIKTMSKCYNSIPSRKNDELFIILLKKM